MVLPLPDNKLLACIPDKELEQKEIEHLESQFPDCKGDSAKAQQYYKAYEYLQLAQMQQLAKEKDLHSSEELDLLFKVCQHKCDESPSLGFLMAMCLYEVRKHVKKTNPDLYKSYKLE